MKCLAAHAMGKAPNNPKIGRAGKSVKDKSFTLHLKPTQGEGSVVVVKLTEPPPKCGEEEVICSITYEPIGSADAFVPFAPSGVPPLSKFPTYTCATLACGHQFHAAAILVSA